MSTRRITRRAAAADNSTDPNTTQPQQSDNNGQQPGELNYQQQPTGNHRGIRFRLDGQPFVPQPFLPPAGALPSEQLANHPQQNQILLEHEQHAKQQAWLAQQQITFQEDQQQHFLGVVHNQQQNQQQSQNLNGQPKLFSPTLLNLPNAGQPPLANLPSGFQLPVTSSGSIPPPGLPPLLPIGFLKATAPGMPTLFSATQFPTTTTTSATTTTTTGSLQNQYNNKDDLQPHQPDEDEDEDDIYQDDDVDDLQDDFVGYYEDEEEDELQDDDDDDDDYDDAYNNTAKTGRRGRAQKSAYADSDSDTKTTTRNRAMNDESSDEEYGKTSKRRTGGAGGRGRGRGRGRGAANTTTSRSTSRGRGRPPKNQTKNDSEDDEEYQLTLTASTNTRSSSRRKNSDWIVDDEDDEEEEEEFGDDDSDEEYGATRSKRTNSRGARGRGGGRGGRGGRGRGRGGGKGRRGDDDESDEYHDDDMDESLDDESDEYVEEFSNFKHGVTTRRGGRTGSKKSELDTSGNYEPRYNTRNASKKLEHDIENEDVNNTGHHHDLADYDEEHDGMDGDNNNNTTTTTGGTSGIIVDDDSDSSFDTSESSEDTSDYAKRGKKKQSGNRRGGPGRGHRGRRGRPPKSGSGKDRDDTYPGPRNIPGSRPQYDNNNNSKSNNKKSRFHADDSGDDSGNIDDLLDQQMEEPDWEDKQYFLRKLIPGQYQQYYNIPPSTVHFLAEATEHVLHNAAENLKQSNVLTKRWKKKVDAFSKMDNVALKLQNGEAVDGGEDPFGMLNGLNEDSSSDDDKEQDTMNDPILIHGDNNHINGVNPYKLADIDPDNINATTQQNELCKSGWGAVGGHKDHIKTLHEMIVLPLLYPEVFVKFNIAPPRGCLFTGPPGTGKTLTARTVANIVQNISGKKVSFFVRKGADCLSKWVGEAERQLRLLFEQAKAMQPSIIFFDEIDGLAPIRNSNQDHVHSSIVSTLLALMDGLDGRGDQVIVIGATNRVDAIDPALRRPGRFDRELLFSLPNQLERLDILKIHTQTWLLDKDNNNNNKNKDNNSNTTKTLIEKDNGNNDGFTKEQKLQRQQQLYALLNEVSMMTPGYSGADLESLCTQASLCCMRRTLPQLYTSTDFNITAPPPQEGNNNNNNNNQQQQPQNDTINLIFQPHTLNHIQINKVDFVNAMKMMTPTSQRMMAKPSKPLNPTMQLLYNTPMNQLALIEQYQKCKTLAQYQNNNNNASTPTTMVVDKQNTNNNNNNNTNTNPENNYKLINSTKLLNMKHCTCCKLCLPPPDITDYIVNLNSHNQQQQQDQQQQQQLIPNNNNLNSYYNPKTDTLYQQLSKQLHNIFPMPNPPFNTNNNDQNNIDFVNQNEQKGNLQSKCILLNSSNLGQTQLTQAMLLEYDETPVYTLSLDNLYTLQQNYGTSTFHETLLQLFFNIKKEHFPASSASAAVKYNSCIIYWPQIHLWYEYTFLQELIPLVILFLNDLNNLITSNSRSKHYDSAVPMPNNIPLTANTPTGLLSSQNAIDRLTSVQHPNPDNTSNDKGVKSMNTLYGSNYLLLGDAEWDWIDIPQDLKNFLFCTTTSHLLQSTCIIDISHKVWYNLLSYPKTYFPKWYTSAGDDTSDDDDSDSDNDNSDDDNNKKRRPMLPSDAMVEQFLDKMAVNIRKKHNRKQKIAFLQTQDGSQSNNNNNNNNKNKLNKNKLSGLLFDKSSSSSLSNKDNGKKNNNNNNMLQSLLNLNDSDDDDNNNNNNDTDRPEDYDDSDNEYADKYQENDLLNNDFGIFSKCCDTANKLNNISNSSLPTNNNNQKNNKNKNQHCCPIHNTNSNNNTTTKNAITNIESNNNNTLINPTDVNVVNDYLSYNTINMSTNNKTNFIVTSALSSLLNIYTAKIQQEQQYLIDKYQQQFNNNGLVTTSSITNDVGLLTDATTTTTTTITGQTNEGVGHVVKRAAVTRTNNNTTTMNDDETTLNNDTTTTTTTDDQQFVSLATTAAAGAANDNTTMQDNDNQHLLSDESDDETIKNLDREKLYYEMQEQRYREIIILHLRLFLRNIHSHLIQQFPEFVLPIHLPNQFIDPIGYCREQNAAAIAAAQRNASHIQQRFTTSSWPAGSINGGNRHGTLTTTTTTLGIINEEQEKGQQENPFEEMEKSMRDDELKFTNQNYTNMYHNAAPQHESQVKLYSLDELSHYDQLQRYVTLQYPAYSAQMPITNQNNNVIKKTIFPTNTAEQQNNNSNDNNNNNPILQHLSKEQATNVVKYSGKLFTLLDVLTKINLSYYLSIKEYLQDIDFIVRQCLYRFSLLTELGRDMINKAYQLQDVALTLSMGIDTNMGLACEVIAKDIRQRLEIIHHPQPGMSNYRNPGAFKERLKRGTLASKSYQKKYVTSATLRKTLTADKNGLITYFFKYPSLLSVYDLERYVVEYMQMKSDKLAERYKAKKLMLIEKYKNNIDKLNEQYNNNNNNNNNTTQDNQKNALMTDSDDDNTQTTTTTTQTTTNNKKRKLQTDDESNMLSSFVDNADTTSVVTTKQKLDLTVKHKKVLLTTQYFDEIYTLLYSLQYFQDIMTIPMLTTLHNNLMDIIHSPKIWLMRYTDNNNDTNAVKTHIEFRIDNKTKNVNNNNNTTGNKQHFEFDNIQDFLQKELNSLTINNNTTQQQQNQSNSNNNNNNKQQTNNTIENLNYCFDLILKNIIKCLKLLLQHCIKYDEMQYNSMSTYKMLKGLEKRQAFMDYATNSNSKLFVYQEQQQIDGNITTTLIQVQRD